MTPAESLTITRMVRAVCPQQKFDEYTPDAWHRLLEDLPFADCETAVIQLGRRQPFISPSEIRAEVQRIRAARIEQEPELTPDADPEDVPAYLAALREGRTRAGDGEKPRDVEQLLKSTIRRLPAPSTGRTTQ
jgi:hypothetical protein